MLAPGAVIIVALDTHFARFRDDGLSSFAFVVHLVPTLWAIRRLYCLFLLAILHQLFQHRFSEILTTSYRQLFYITQCDFPCCWLSRQHVINRCFGFRHQARL